MIPEGVQRHFRAVHRQTGHCVDERAHAAGRLALTQGGNAHGGVQHCHAQVLPIILYALPPSTKCTRSLMPQAAAKGARKPVESITSLSSGGLRMMIWGPWECFGQKRPARKRWLPSCHCRANRDAPGNRRQARKQRRERYATRRA